MTQDAKRLSLAATKLVLDNDIYSCKDTLLLLLLSIINMALGKFPNYFLLQINSESPLILSLLLK